MNNFVKRALWTLIPFIVGVALVRLAAPARVEVTWKTASEVDAAGFRLYRSEDAEGPFVLISPNLILARGDPLVGEDYDHEDTDVVWGKRYYYQLEEISLSGAADRYPQTVAALAGPGWGWALGAGSVLALLGFLTGHQKSSPAAPVEDQEIKLRTGV
ncbi:MAG: hypothetical protein RBT75_15775 [Anaerolineae bacterium]|jgi:hypothetical protein|nr:hypothetical protein [Anaerolineae bacterium]